MKAVFGKVTQANPVHYRDDQRRQRRIGSLDADLTKFPDKICQHCNGARTQPHDRAWETLSMALRTCRPKLSPGMYVRTDRHGIFPYNTARHMVDMHLFFVKQFGCFILEGRAPIDIASFAAAIMNNKPHPALFLKFACGPTIPSNPLVARSNLHVMTRKDGSVTGATWFYQVDALAVQVMYAERGMQAGHGWWHPSLGTNRILIGDISK